MFFRMYVLCSLQQVNNARPFLLPHGHITHSMCTLGSPPAFPAMYILMPITCLHVVEELLGSLFLMVLQDRLIELLHFGAPGIQTAALTKESHALLDVLHYTRTQSPDKVHQILQQLSASLTQATHPCTRL